MFLILLYSSRCSSCTRLFSELPEIENFVTKISVDYDTTKNFVIQKGITKTPAILCLKEDSEDLQVFYGVGNIKKIIEGIAKQKDPYAESAEVEPIPPVVGSIKDIIKSTSRVNGKANTMEIAAMMMAKAAEKEAGREQTKKYVHTKPKDEKEPRKGKTKYVHTRPKEEKED